KGLPFCPHLVRENLRNKHPDHRSLREGEKGYVNHQVNGDGQRSGEKSCGTVVEHIERVRNHGQRRNEAERSDEHQLATAYPVDKTKCNQRKHKIDQSDTHRRQQGTLNPESRQLKYAWRIINNGIDTCELVEYRNQKGQHNRLPMLTHEQAVLVLKAGMTITITNNRIRFLFVIARVNFE